MDKGCKEIYVYMKLAILASDNMSMEKYMACEVLQTLGYMYSKKSAVRLSNMNGCEHCISLKDLDDFSSGKMYVVGLGFVFDSKPQVDEVVVMAESRLDEYRKGLGEWQVIATEKLPKGYNKFEAQEAIIRMCGKYGAVNISDDPVNMSHEERIEIADEISEKLFQKPYVTSVYLTGSTASNLDRKDSDADLLVVLERCPGNNEHCEIDKLGENYPCPVDVFCIREKDFSIAADLQYPLIRNRSLIRSK